MGLRTYLKMKNTAPILSEGDKMETILFINACIRESSRTKKLADAALKQYIAERTAGEEKTEKKSLFGEIFKTNVIERDLACFPVAPLDKSGLERRENGGDTGFDGSFFELAKEFSSAETVIVAAPYWDLSFPAVLKAYFEAVCVCGLTFHYGEDGMPHSLCKAKRLIYVTTSGGYIGEMNFGFDYVKGLCKIFFEIDDARFISAQGLDIDGNDPEKILFDAIDRLTFDF